VPSYRFTAIAPAGEVQEGVMEAPSEAAVIARLQRQGSIPIRAEPATGGSFWSGLLSRDFGRGRTLRAQETADLTRELATMLDAGQDLDRALRFCEETAPNARARGVMNRLREAVRDGAPLSAALAQHPASFSRLYVGMIRAGEAGGQLAATLGHLARLLEQQRSLAATVKSALVYPVLLTVAAIGSIALLLTEVLPQFVPLFEQSGAKLPPATQFLIDTGAFVSNYGLLLLAAVGAGFLGLRLALRRPGVRLPADRFLLRVPFVGGLVREVLAARFTRTLGTLVINGVPLIAALEIVREVVGNLAAAGAVERAIRSARGGGGLARALEETRVFPSRTMHLIRLGEENAQLGPVALRAAEIHEEKTRLGVQRLVSLLVPAITIVMGAAVAGIVASLVLAMLALNDLAT
jgi:general secretion pathway protein F